MGQSTAACFGMRATERTTAGPMFSTRSDSPLVSAAYVFVRPFCCDRPGSGRSVVQTYATCVKLMSIDLRHRCFWTPPRATHWQLRTLVFAVLLVVLLAPAMAQAQSSVGSPENSDWTGPLISGSVSAIFTPASGALLVRTKDDLLQSDDGGQTFRSLPLPPDSRTGERFVSVDPTDQHVLYASGDEPLYRSTDGGGTWRPILTSASYAGFEVAAFTESPVDASVLYAELVQGPTRESYLLLASHDRGATWTTLQSRGPVSLCGWGVRLLQAHPTDAMQVFLSSGCFAGR